MQRGLQQVQLCSLGIGRLPGANLYQRAIIHLFIFLNLRTTAFLSNSQPCEFCFLCSSRSMASAQALLSFPHGAPDRDINLEYPEAFPSRYQDYPMAICLVCGFASLALFPPSEAGLSSLLILVNPVFVSKASVLSELGAMVRIMGKRR